MAAQPVYTLINKQNGNLAFKIFGFDDNSHFDHIQRNNYFTLIWIMKGTGKLNADFSEYDFECNSLFTFYPYQPFMLSATNSLQGFTIHFHPDFFCIYRHHKEISCNGILFNNSYQQPYVIVDDSSEKIFSTLIQQMIHEIMANELEQEEVLTSYLKVFLITATRLKVQQQTNVNNIRVNNKQLFIVQNLKDAIEQHFKKMHTASDYAALLNISGNALARITKVYFNKTLTDLIAERIIIEAKRELYLTKKPVKEIAFELGYEDEYYFSRFFKINADISPQVYRDTVGFGRGIA